MCYELLLYDASSENVVLQDLFFNKSPSVKHWVIDLRKLPGKSRTGEL